MDNQYYLTSLSLINFKNYAQAELSLSPSMNCFIGENGAGKTNVLDAIYYLSMCKSYLNPIDSQNIKFDESFFVIQSRWQNRDGEDEIYCGVKKGQKKVFKKNKVVYEKLADHIGRFPTVMISPYDRDLILEGSETRRKWMDGFISQFDRAFLSNLINYNKVLAQRNALLKSMSDFGAFDEESVEIWDLQLVELGNQIFKVRKQGVEEFIPIFQKYYQWVSNEKEEVGLTYRSHLFEGPFDELLKLSQKDDLRRQFTTIGIHKDDLIFTINGYPVKKFGSQGQQKSFLIALKLAQYEWLKERLNTKPILLLDDIFDKLDGDRVERLMQLVNNQNFGQVLLTDTDKERISSIFERNKIEYKLFLIQDNLVEELQPKVATL